MSGLQKFLTENNVGYMEGHSAQVPGQVEFLKDIVQHESIKNVMEIGFNAGHSAEIFLSSNENINLTSFDIGVHAYLKKGKKYIDTTYPNRHSLVLGNSLITVPEYFEKNNTKFDIIFIDGNHEYIFAVNDLKNCKNLAHEKTIIILDDTYNGANKAQFNIGPNSAWSEAKQSGLVKELGSIDFQYARGSSWGNYNF